MKAFWLQQKQVKVASYPHLYLTLFRKLQLIMQYDLEPRQEVQLWWLAWGAKLSLFRDDMIFYLDNSVELIINAIKTNKSSVKQTDKD